MSNVSLFKKYARAQDSMMRATMPKAAEATDAVVTLAATIEQRIVARVGGTTLVSRKAKVA